MIENKIVNKETKNVQFVTALFNVYVQQKI